jgi:hypothetical protein
LLNQKIEKKFILFTVHSESGPNQISKLAHGIPLCARACPARQATLWAWAGIIAMPDWAANAGPGDHGRPWSSDGRPQI